MAKWIRLLSLPLARLLLLVALSSRVFVPLERRPTESATWISSPFQSSCARGEEKLKQLNFGSPQGRVPSLVSSHLHVTLAGKSVTWQRALSPQLVSRSLGAHCYLVTRVFWTRLLHSRWPRIICAAIRAPPRPEAESKEALMYLVIGGP